MTIIIMIMIINLYHGKSLLKWRKVPTILTYSGGTIWSHHHHQMMLNGTTETSYLFKNISHEGRCGVYVSPSDPNLSNTEPKSMDLHTSTASKKLHSHFNLLNHPTHNMTTCDLSLNQGNTESHKNFEKKFIFNSALMTLVESMNASQLTTLFIYL